MCKIIIYKEDKEWLTVNLPEPVKLSELLTTIPTEGGSYYVSLTEKGTEIERTSNCDEKTISHHIDALLDHLLDAGQDEEVSRLVDEIDVLAGHKKKTSWMFWACLGFLGFSALNILYRTAFAFFKAIRVNILTVSVNLVLAAFLIWGITFFIRKYRKQNT